jgi:ubiquinone/menaquinone biosynthesis C-methylase UbiE
MGKKNSNRLFNTIAPVYGLFYARQKARYRNVIDGAASELNLASYDNILDVGCGTGSLCSVLSERGLAVTGIDPAEKMLRFAKRQPENRNVAFLQANVLDRLPFDDKSFDLSIASYVAHGMQKNERLQLYAEMRRVTKHKVIIFDYNQNRALLTSVVEWLERGDYFRFILNPATEMRDCISEMSACFSEVHVIDVDARAAWYICTPL